MAGHFSTQRSESCLASLGSTRNGIVAPAVDALLPQFIRRVRRIILALFVVARDRLEVLP
jgi:hypothetical protein